MDSKSVTCNMLFLCRELTEGLYNKVNIYDLIPGSDIYVASFPYILETKVCAYLTNIELPNSIVLEIHYLEKVIIKVSTTISTKQSNSLVLAFPFKINVQGESEFTVRLSSDKGMLLCQTKFIIRKGDSPLHKVINSEVVTGVGKDVKTIEHIFERVLQSILIIDNFPSASQWLPLLSKCAHAQIRIIVGRKDKKSECEELRKVLPKLEYKLLEIQPDKPYFHDRFIIVDNTEFYHLGQSFKDIANSNWKSFKDE